MNDHFPDFFLLIYNLYTISDIFNELNTLNCNIRCGPDKLFLH